MEFSEICDAVYPLLKGRCKNRAELFDFLVLNCIDENNDCLSEELSHYSYKQKSKITNGTASFDHVGSKLLGSFDSSNLQDCIFDSVLPESIQDCINELAAAFPGISQTNYCERIASAVHDAVVSSAKRYRSQATIREIKLKEMLFEEDGGICPICKQSFSKNDGEKALTVAFIDPSKGEVMSNVIGLCRSCGAKIKSGHIKTNLFEIKKELKGQKAREAGLSDLAFDDELAGAVKKMFSSPLPAETKLKYEGLRIDQKIGSKESPALSTKVKAYVAVYFPRLSELFHEADGKGRRSFSKLCSSMRLAYLSLEENGLEKEEIFDRLALDVQSKTDCQRSVAEAIVSYFIQECEVLDEISE